MIRLTITLKSTAHQIVLGYTNIASCRAALDKADLDGAPANGKVPINLADDYGQSVQYLNADLAWLNMTDMDSFIAYKVAVLDWQARGEHEGRMHFEQRPNLRPFVGGGDISAMFGG